VSLIQANLPPVSLIPVAILPSVSLIPVVHLDLQNGPNGIFWDWGETDYEKNQKQKTRDIVALIGEIRVIYYIDESLQSCCHIVLMRSLKVFSIALLTCTRNKAIFKIRHFTSLFHILNRDSIK
jgi:hypothetical protein